MHQSFNEDLRHPVIKSEERSLSRSPEGKPSVVRQLIKKYQKPGESDADTISKLKKAVTFIQQVFKRVKRRKELNKLR